MAAGPTTKAVNAALRKAKAEAEAFSQKYNVSCLPFIQRASNGEACLMYRLGTGEVYTSLDVAERVQRDREATNAADPSE